MSVNSGNKFMVIKVKELMKTLIFAILGVIIIVWLVSFVTSKFSTATTMYVPGTYSSQIQLDNGNATVHVKVDKKKIIAIEITQESETVPVFYPLLETAGEELAEKIVAQQSTEVSVKETNQYTSALILGAVEESLEKASAK